MPRQDPQLTARLLIGRHGLAAQAVALEHVQEMRVERDPLGLDRWQSIHAAICELRRSGSHRAEPDRAKGSRR